MTYMEQLRQASALLFTPGTEKYREAAKAIEDAARRAREMGVAQWLR